MCHAIVLGAWEEGNIKVCKQVSASVILIHGPKGLGLDHDAKAAILQLEYKRSYSETHFAIHIH